MTRLTTTLTFCLALVGCGAPPTAPSVVDFREGAAPGRNIIIGGICAPGSCSVARLITNMGNACATDVHVEVAALDSFGKVLATYEWVLEPNRIVRPLDSVEVRVDVAYAINQAAPRWRTVATEWRQVSCV